MPDFESIAGQLLVASPTLVDPNFARSVVFMMEHDEQGAVGIVLNRPTEADVLDHLPGWFSSTVNPRVVFIGGPVGEGGGIGLARGTGGEPLAGWPETLGVRAVDLETEPGDRDLLDVRIFVGYSGWAPGQLEAELGTGSWFVVDADPEDAFTDDPSSLWSSVLERAGGRHAWIATYPVDPRLN